MAAREDKRSAREGEGVAAVLAESPRPNATVPLMDLPGWTARFGLAAGITTRGPSGAPADPWERLRTAVGPGFATVAFSHQVHGHRVYRHDGPGERLVALEGYDGHITASAGVLLAVNVADCVPVYLSTRDGRAVGLLHAGWRGTAAGILERGVEYLSGVAGAPSGDIVMHCGISICGACYEVGPEVMTAVVGRGAGGPERLDLRAELARRARVLGVGEVTVSPWCSAHHGARFYSHRASGGRAGRMLAFLGRPRARE